MSTDTTFRGHYDEWTTKRIHFIESHFGSEWFRGKRVLELGCGHARIGSHFARLGATVTCSDARSEHLAAIKARDPNLEVVEADLNNQWPFEGRFDLILHLGLLNHLEDFHFSIRRAFESSDRVILETEVSDSLNDQAVLPVDENKSMYDQSFTGRGSCPSAGYLEKLFAEHGFRALRLSDDRCNSRHEGLHHVYDWPCKGTDGWEHGRRRLWVLTRKSICPQPCSDNISVVVQGLVGHLAPKFKRIFLPIFPVVWNQLRLERTLWMGAFV